MRGVACAPGRPCCCPQRPASGSPAPVSCAPPPSPPPPLLAAGTPSRRAGCTAGTLWSRRLWRGTTAWRWWSRCGRGGVGSSAGQLAGGGAAHPAARLPSPLDPGSLCSPLPGSLFPHPRRWAPASRAWRKTTGSSQPSRTWAPGARWRVGVERAGGRGGVGGAGQVGAGQIMRSRLPPLGSTPGHCAECATPPGAVQWPARRICSRCRPT